VLVLRHHWQGAVALGLLLAVFGSPAIVAAVRTTDPTNRWLLAVLSLACPGAGLALAVFGWVRRNSLTVVDRTKQTIAWGSRVVAFSDLDGIVLRTRQTREGADHRGRASEGVSFELVATLSDGSERKIMTAVRPDSLSHVADRLARLTGTRKL